MAARRHASQQPPIHPDAAEISIEASQIAQRALHVRAWGVMLIEQLGGVDARRREHRGERYNG